MHDAPIAVARIHYAYGAGYAFRNSLVKTLLLKHYHADTPRAWYFRWYVQQGQSMMQGDLLLKRVIPPRYRQQVFSALLPAVAFWQCMLSPYFNTKSGFWKNPQKQLCPKCFHLLPFDQTIAGIRRRSRVSMVVPSLRAVSYSLASSHHESRRLPEIASNHLSSSPG